MEIVSDNSLGESLTLFPPAIFLSALMSASIIAIFSSVFLDCFLGVFVIYFMKGHVFLLLRDRRKTQRANNGFYGSPLFSPVKTFSIACHIDAKALPIVLNAESSVFCEFFFSTG